MIKVDFDSLNGKIKPLHGVNCGPLQSYDCSYDVRKPFRDAGIPFSRLHDTEYPFGSGLFVDIHCVFPDFDADENDPDSYRFYHTDKFISAIFECGAVPFYRLGESIDHGENKLYVHPPKDVHKWARICEHIIAHYNEGWADGYKYAIKYWEIWNEPENSPMWTGTNEQYFELYTVTSNHLKNRFGDSISIGGYASCGFHALEKEYDNGSIFTHCMAFYKAFLKHITSEDGKAPLDFFSFHIYSGSIERLRLHADFCRESLDEYGFTDTQIFLNEWNRSGNYYENINANAAAYFAAVMCAAQRMPLDGCMFYGAGHSCPEYNNLFDNVDRHLLKPYYAFLSFNKLYELSQCAESICTTDSIQVCAATDGKIKRILICNPGDDCREGLEISGISGSMKQYVINLRSNLEMKCEIPVRQGYIDIGCNSVILLTSE